MMYMHNDVLDELCKCEWPLKTEVDGRHGLTQGLVQFFFSVAFFDHSGGMDKQVHRI